MNILHKSLLAICLAAISVGNNHCIAAMPAPVVEAIAEVYGDGIALSTVILDYDQPIMASSVDVSDFSIPGRNIIQAYVANHASKGNQKITAGKYIVLELEQLPMTDQGLAPVHDDNDRAARKKSWQKRTGTERCHDIAANIGQHHPTGRNEPTGCRLDYP